MQSALKIEVLKQVVSFDALYNNNMILDFTCLLPHSNERALIGLKCASVPMVLGVKPISQLRFDYDTICSFFARVESR